MELSLVELELKGNEIIIGQGNFSLKTVDDLARVVISSVPNIKVGVAMNDGSAKITRVSGNDEKLEKIAGENAYRLRAGHTFVIMISGGFPVNVLNELKNVPGVCKIMAATSNPVQAVVATSEKGGAVLGVVDGGSSEKIEEDNKRKERRQTLEKIGYRLG